MTCAEAAELLDAFVDAELPGPVLLAVARHAGGCATCDQALREVTEVREAVEQTLRAEADALDLSGVWRRVEHDIRGIERRRPWVRRLRLVPAWGAAAALAAGLAVWMRAPEHEPERLVRARPNQANIERLESIPGARVGIVKDRKLGTTLIMISAPADEVGP